MTGRVDTLPAVSMRSRNRSQICVHIAASGALSEYSGGMSSGDPDYPGSEDIPDRIVENDSRLEHFSDANDRWEEVPERLAEDWDSMAKLIAYYESMWRDDVRDFPEAPFGVLSEDGVWNEMGRFYESVKEIALTADRIVREYEADNDPEVDPGTTPTDEEASDGIAPGADAAVIDEP